MGRICLRHAEKIWRKIVVTKVTAVSGINTGLGLWRNRLSWY